MPASDDQGTSKMDSLRSRFSSLLLDVPMHLPKRHQDSMNLSRVVQRNVVAHYRQGNMSRTSWKGGRGVTATMNPRNVGAMLSVKELVNNTSDKPTKVLVEMFVKKCCTTMDFLRIVQDALASEEFHLLFN